MTVLTIDLGTSATKAALWDGPELIGLTRAAIVTERPTPGFAIQDPEHWWSSTLEACAQLRRDAPHAYALVDTVGFSTARETFACFDRNLRPVTDGILWSDARAVTEADVLGDPIQYRHDTGVRLGPACPAAKIAWLRARQPDRFDAATWILGPRDLVAARLTGTVRTEPTVASRTGLYALDGTLLGDDPIAERLPPVVPSTTLAPALARHDLQLDANAHVLLGAGDRACEALAVGATGSAPMVSWGTTANVSVPHPGPIDRLPAEDQVSVGADAQFLLEAGLSAAGSALDWLAALTGQDPARLAVAAAEVDAGAEGVLVLPWLDGARAPWWRPDTRAVMLGLGSSHRPAHLARAMIEGVALDVARCIERLASGATDLGLAGRGAANRTWRAVLAAVTRSAVTLRANEEGASVGARLLVSWASGEALTVDALNPVVTQEQPDPDLVAMYRAIRDRSDAAIAAILDSPTSAAPSPARDPTDGSSPGS